MVEDRYFYDPEAGQLHRRSVTSTISTNATAASTRSLSGRYIPISALTTAISTTWSATMPGGIHGVRRMVADFHRRGVKVFFPFHGLGPGNRDSGTADWDATAKLMAEIGADGVNGDTLRRPPSRIPNSLRRRRTSGGASSRNSFSISL